MKLDVYGQKIVYGKNTTSYLPVLKVVDITKIKNTATRKGQSGYYGYCPNYLLEFPEDNPKDKLFNKSGWCHFIKAHQDIKVPVVPMGCEIDVSNI